MLVARSLAAVLGDAVVLDVDGVAHVVEHADPARHLLLNGHALALHRRVAASVVARARIEGTQRVPLVQQRDVPRLAGPDGRPALEEIGVHSLVAAPIRFDGTTVGIVLCSRDHAGRPYGIDDARATERYADLAARALACGDAERGLPRAG